MNDPIMCRPQDRQNETSVAKILAAHYGLNSLSETAKNMISVFDVSLWDAAENLKFLVEVKARRYDWGTHATYTISQKKLQNCLRHVNQLRAGKYPDCRFLLAVKDRKGDVYVTQINDLTEFEVAPGGRTDRVGVSTDWEPMVHIPITLFNLISN